MVDNGRISTYLITIVGIVYAIIIALGAAGLVQIGIPEQYAGIVILIVTTVYNLAYPRNPQVEGQA
jgi:hypothetical protein